MNISHVVPSFLQICLSQNPFCLLLESVLKSKEDLKSITAKGKGKWRNVRDKYRAGKFLEAKLGLKVI